MAINTKLIIEFGTKNLKKVITGLQNFGNASTQTGKTIEKSMIGASSAIAGIGDTLDKVSRRGKLANKSFMDTRRSLRYLTTELKKTSGKIPGLTARQSADIFSHFKSSSRRDIFGLKHGKYAGLGDSFGSMIIRGLSGKSFYKKLAGTHKEAVRNWAHSYGNFVDSMSSEAVRSANHINRKLRRGRKKVSSANKRVVASKGAESDIYPFSLYYGGIQLLGFSGRSFDAAADRETQYYQFGLLENDIGRDGRVRTGRGSDYQKIRKASEGIYKQTGVLAPRDIAEVIKELVKSGTNFDVATGLFPTLIGTAMLDARNFDDIGAGVLKLNDLVGNVDKYVNTIIKPGATRQEGIDKRIEVMKTISAFVQNSALGFDDARRQVSKLLPLSTPIAGSTVQSTFGLLALLSNVAGTNRLGTLTAAIKQTIMDPLIGGLLEGMQFGEGSSNIVYRKGSKVTVDRVASFVKMISNIAEASDQIEKKGYTTAYSTNSKGERKLHTFTDKEIFHKWVKEGFYKLIRTSKKREGLEVLLAGIMGGQLDALDAKKALKVVELEQISEALVGSLPYEKARFRAKTEKLLSDTGYLFADFYKGMNEYFLPSLEKAVSLLSTTGKDGAKKPNLFGNILVGTGATAIIGAIAFFMKWMLGKAIELYKGIWTGKIAKYLMGSKIGRGLSMGAKMLGGGLSAGFKILGRSKGNIAAVVAAISVMVFASKKWIEFTEWLGPRFPILAKGAKYLTAVAVLIEKAISVVTDFLIRILKFMWEKNPITKIVKWTWGKVKGWWDEGMLRGRIYDESGENRIRVPPDLNKKMDFWSSYKNPMQKKEIELLGLEGLNKSLEKKGDETSPVIINLNFPNGKQTIELDKKHLKPHNRGTVMEYGIPQWE